jgi:hypothetical protein
VPGAETGHRSMQCCVRDNCQRTTTATGKVYYWVRTNEGESMTMRERERLVNVRLGVHISIYATQTRYQFIFLSCSNSASEDQQQSRQGIQAGGRISWRTGPCLRKVDLVSYLHS